MASTLSNYEDLINDPVVSGIAHTILVSDPLLQVLPFKGITSNTIKYKMETAEADARFYEVAEEWVEGAPTWEDRYADLAILGGDADVDKFVMSTMGAQEPVQAEIIALKAKAIANKWANNAIMGRTTSKAAYSSSKNFKGLLRLIAECESSTATDLDGGLTGATSAAENTQVLVRASGVSGALTLDYIDELLDMVKPQPTHIMSSRMFRRKLTALARAAGTNLEHDKNSLGMPVTRYGNVEVLISDGVLDNCNDNTTVVTAIASWDYTQARAATKDVTPIFAFRVGEDGLCGITSAQNGMIQTEPIGTLQNKDALRTRIKFYCGMALFNKLAAAVLMEVCLSD